MLVGPTKNKVVPQIYRSTILLLLMGEESLNNGAMLHCRTVQVNNFFLKKKPVQ
jgi:hypothetical protein